MNIEPLSARSRILLAASDLFYEQGFKATGVNEIIKRASVAKATFYAHYESKDSLCFEYLSNRDRVEIVALKQSADDSATPLGKYLALSKSVESYVESTDHRGCAFLNLAAEIPDRDNPLRQVGMDHYNELRLLQREVTDSLLVTDFSLYGHLSGETVAARYLTIVIGGMALSEIYGERWPVQGLPEQVLELLN